MPQQRRVESGTRDLHVACRRRRRRDGPARGRGACRLRRGGPQQNRHDVVFFSSHGEPAGGREIERRNFAPEFDQHGRERPRSQGIVRGPQNVERPHCADKGQPIGVETELEKARTVDLAGFHNRQIMARPKQSAVRGRPQGKRQRKPAG